MARKATHLLCFDDLSVGDEWESPRRTVTETDVVNFAGVSGDFNPIHIDHASAATGPFRRPIAHGLLGLSIASGLTAYSPRVDTMAFLAILEWKFLQPIYFGDTIRVLTRIVALESKSRGRRGVVTWHRQILNQEDKIVQEGLSQTIVRGRGRSESSDPESGPDESG
ncbi:MAG: MaoC/PaaZ C-terminal domain-containing protein [Isosphaeraceae bacterium]